MNFSWRGAWGGGTGGTGSGSGGGTSGDAEGGGTEDGGSAGSPPQDKGRQQHTNFFPWKTFWGVTTPTKDPPHKPHSAPCGPADGGVVDDAHSKKDNSAREGDAGPGPKRLGYFSGYFRGYVVSEDDEEAASEASSVSGDGVRRVVTVDNELHHPTEESCPRGSYFTFPWKTRDDAKTGAPVAFPWRREKVANDDATRDSDGGSRGEGKVAHGTITFPWRKSSKSGAETPGEEPSFTLPWGAAEKDDPSIKGDGPTRGKESFPFSWKREESPKTGDGCTQTRVSSLTIPWTKGKNDPIGEVGGAGAQDGGGGGEGENDGDAGVGGGAKPGAKCHRSQAGDSSENMLGDGGDGVLGGSNGGGSSSSGGGGSGGGGPEGTRGRVPGSSSYMEHLSLLTSRAVHLRNKILQNLGKADRTVDDVFDEYEINFNRQQTNANRLHKEVANYLRCCRALHGASKSLFETLAEVYEPEWVGHELLYAQAQNSDMLWTDFCHKLQDQTLTPLTAYQQQFPEFRKKIDKRGRKLVDYDSQRHQLENLQRAGRRDEYKIARSRDTLETARVTYEALNKELYDELPTLYDQRIPNVSSSLQALFAAEATVMAESSKVAKELEAIAEKLSKECAKGTYKVKRGVAPRPLSVVEPVSPKTINSPSMWYDGGAVEEGGNSLQSLEGNEGTLDITNTEENQDSSATLEHKESYKPILDSVERTPTPPPSPLPLESPTNDADSAPSAPIDSEHDTNNRPTISGPVTTNKEETGRPYEEIEFEDKKVNGTVSPQARTNGEVIGTKIPPAAGSALCNGPSFTSPLAELDKKVEEIYDIPVGATTEGLPQGVLYRVRATYKYTREDVDEIGFEVGDTIQVVEYDDPEEQEEGWLTGIKEGTQEKGLFPANFTRPI
ncbi:myc box-dependent-interacting protein 1 isoform X2 [Procambarus clarkii]|uniref:myc box-dependent-interacting protein 1 isoform X2 n=1 Tax=Procambarus clarkii TaxID=6728 RepID=UPI00374281D3